MIFVEYVLLISPFLGTLNPNKGQRWAKNLKIMHYDYAFKNYAA